MSQCDLSRVLILVKISPKSGESCATPFGPQLRAREPLKLSPDSAVIAAAYYLKMLVGVFTMGYMIQWMGLACAAEQPLARTCTRATNTATPLFLVGILELAPILWLNFLVGAPASGCTVLLLYTGVPIMMGILE